MLTNEQKQEAAERGSAIVTTSVLVTITDIGTAVQFTVTGQTITVIECGGCPVEEIFQGKLNSQNPETTDQDFIRGLWLSGYDGDPEANGLRVEVEYLDRAAQAAYEAVLPEPMKFIFSAGRHEEIGDFMTYEKVNERAVYLAESWKEHVTVTERFDKSNTWVVEVPQ